MTRREYLSLTAAAAAATIGSSLGCRSAHSLETTRKKKSLIPTRVLGKTGVEVPIIGFGTGSKFQNAHVNREDEAVQLLHHAVDLGINWLETAHIYGKNGWAEKIVGQVLKTRREGGLRYHENPRPHLRRYHASSRHFAGTSSDRSH
ncbi:MAG: aldo/keto reductase [Fermentimonas sp.]